MKRYKAYIICFYFFLVLFSQIISPAIQWKEVFPFFHWNLFSVSSKEYEDYQVYFPQYDCELKTCKFLRPEAQDPEVYYLMQELGRSFALNSSDFKRIKNQFNAIVFIDNNILPYQIRLRKLEPVDYLKNGRIKESVLIGDVHE
jgi:hypothetical protein